jgi:hypothetical protein
MCLDSLLLTYNLSSTVNFPIRIKKNSISAIDNIFIDNSKLEKYNLTPFSNGLSDHEAQFLEIYNINPELQNQQQKLIRRIDNHSMADFIMKLSYETCDTVFNNANIFIKFNYFLNTYLRIFYSSFPLRRVKKRIIHNIWMTTGIKTSCEHKRELYLAIRDCKDIKLRRYCKVLSNVIHSFIHSFINIP